MRSRHRTPPDELHLLAPLTPRERDVLDLIAEGRTNGEIADALGISFPTAKNHVSSVLSKLGTSSRIEAGDWWRDHRDDDTAAPRAGWLRGLWRLPWPRIGSAVALGSAAVAVVALGVAVVLAAAHLGDDGSPAGDPAATGTPVTPTAAESPQETPTAPPPETETPAVTISGLDQAPRESPPTTTRDLPPRPEPPFAPWDGTSTIIYDTVTGTARDLGPGSVASFSPDGTMAVWLVVEQLLATPGEAYLIDLATSEEQLLGEGRLVQFQQDGRVALATGDGPSAVLIDVQTGERELVEEAGGLFESPVHPVILPTSPPEYTIGIEVRNDLVDDGALSSIYTLSLRDRATGELLLRFEALNAVFAGSDELVVATPVRDSLTNIYTLDIATGEVEFVAPVTIERGTLPVVASDEYIAWTANHCGIGGGMLQVYNRETGELATIDLSSIAEESRADLLFVDDFTPDGNLALGTFGARTVINPETLEYVTVLPDEAVGDIHWSPDYRYASRGQFPAHGGRCA